MPTDDGPDHDGPNLDLDVPRRLATHRDAALRVSSGAGPLVVIVLGAHNPGVESDKGLEYLGRHLPSQGPTGRRSTRRSARVSRARLRRGLVVVMDGIESS
jgi:hypothetical protein